MSSTGKWTFSPVERKKFVHIWEELGDWDLHIHIIDTMYKMDN